MVLTNKNVLVVGLGKSGLALANVLFRLGARLSLYDKKSEQELECEIASLAKISAQYFLGGASPDFIKAKYDLVVVSPGVSLEIKPLLDAKACGVDIIGELELAFQLTSAPLIAVP